MEASMSKVIPKYCTKCGKELVINYKTYTTGKFNPLTGEPEVLSYTEVKCDEYDKEVLRERELGASQLKEREEKEKEEEETYRKDYALYEVELQRWRERSFFEELLGFLQKPKIPDRPSSMSFLRDPYRNKDLWALRDSTFGAGHTYQRIYK